MKALVLLCIGALGGCMGTQAPTPQAEPAAAAPVYTLSVESFTCKESRGGVRASVAVRNTGSTAIKHAQVFFRIGAETVDTFLSPSTIQPQGMATANRMVKTTGGCELVAIQGGQGHAATLEYPAQ